MDYSLFKEIKLSDSRLDLWFKLNQNVLMAGNHGTGKSTMIIDTFERNGLIKNDSYMMFSGATLDPWTDFIGIPKKVESDNGDYLEYIRPKYMNDKLQAIFMDEFNRTSPKVRNALMELIQFKSINGKVFPNLKVVWAAVNPDEDEYDIDDIDPAQADRFHIQIKTLDSPDEEYFSKKFGNFGTTATTWWKTQNIQSKKLISPRRLEYVINYYKLGGDISEALPNISNISQLKKMFKDHPIISELDTFIANGDINSIKKIFEDENSLDQIIKDLVSDKKYFTVLGNNLPEEHLSNILSSNDEFFEWAVNNHQIMFSVRNALKNIYDSTEYVQTDKRKFRVDKLDAIFKYKKNKDKPFLVKKQVGNILSDYKETDDNLLKKN